MSNDNRHCVDIICEMDRVLVNMRVKMSDVLVIIINKCYNCTVLLIYHLMYVIINNNYYIF